MDQHSEHDDVRSEHSDQDHENQPVEHDDGKSFDITLCFETNPDCRVFFFQEWPDHLLCSTMLLHVVSVVGAESDMDLDLLAESDSDSESEHSRDQDNVSVQRSAITTAATAGSEAGLAYFSEDESGDSSNQEDEESDAEGSEEHDDTDDAGEKITFVFHTFMVVKKMLWDHNLLKTPSSCRVFKFFGFVVFQGLLDGQLERRNTAQAQGQRTLQTPQTMQWAVRQREATSSRPTTSTTPATNSKITALSDTVKFSSERNVLILMLHIFSSGSGVIYIDANTLRRTTQATAVAGTNQDNTVTMATTASQLARAFGIIVRQIADLLTMLHDYHQMSQTLPRVLDISGQEAMDLQVRLLSLTFNLVDLSGCCFVS